MQALQYANLGLRFLLELCGLAAFGYWGFQTGSSTLLKFVLGIGAPLLMGVVWGLFIAPKSVFPNTHRSRVFLGLIVFAVASAALYFAGHMNLAWTFGIAAVVNTVLMLVWPE